MHRLDRHTSLTVVGGPVSGKFLSRGYQGTVYLLDSGVERRVVKQAMGGWFSHWLRRAMLRREYAAYQRVAGIPGIPRCFGLEADGSLLLEFLVGDSFRENTPNLHDRDQFLGQLQAQILALHKAGVAHADLKRRGNLLISPEGNPILLDFGSAVLRQANGGWWNRFLFAQGCRMDLNAWIKLKYRGRYDRLSPEDQFHYQPTVLEGVARLVRRAWRKMTARHFRKEWKKNRENHRRRLN